MLPYYKWYPQDWLSDPKVRLLTLAEKGAYREILDSMWVRASGMCAIEDDINLLASVLNQSVLVTRNIRDKLVRYEFLVVRDGCLINLRLSEEHELGSRLAALRSKSGVQGARKSLEIKRRNQAIAQQMPTKTETKPKPTTKPEPNNEDSVNGFFDTFWSVYPKKVGKIAAHKSWDKLKPSQEFAERMIAKVNEFTVSEQWRKEGGKYIPNPETWLNQGRWDDEVGTKVKQLTWEERYGFAESSSEVPEESFGSLEAGTGERDD